MNPWPILIVFALLGAALLAFVWWRLRARALGPADKRRIARAWAAAEANPDPRLPELAAALLTVGEPVTP